MGRNPFVDYHVSQYARMNAAQKARHDLEQSMPYSQTFSRKQFPSLAAWARFLTLRCALDERLFGDQLPERHVEKRGANVLDAREAKERAIAGAAMCGGCKKESGDVDRYKLTGTSGVVAERHLCPQCARLFAYDSWLGYASVERAPL